MPEGRYIAYYRVSIPPITARLVDAGNAISEESPDKLRFL